MVSKLKLKLFLKKKSVLYAEVEKDFVDFLFSLLTLPVGSVVKHVQKNLMVGCIANLYKSIENLRDDCIQTGKNKNMILNPPLPFVPFGPNSPCLLQNDPNRMSKKFYTCSGYNHRYFTDFRGVHCPKCNSAMTTECNYVPNDGSSSSSVGGGGFVKGAVTYFVTDDLDVKPMDTNSLRNLLKKHSVKDVGKLQQIEVDVGEAERLAILKASLKSKTVLTETFMSCG